MPPPIRAKPKNTANNTVEEQGRRMEAELGAVRRITCAIYSDLLFSNHKPPGFVNAVHQRLAHWQGNFFGFGWQLDYHTILSAPAVTGCKSLSERRCGPGPVPNVPGCYLIIP